MGEHKSSRARSPLKLKKQSLRVLGWDELGQVVGGVRDAVVIRDFANGRNGSRFCPDW